MKKEDLIILILGLLLLAAMLLTLFLGGEESRHGVGRILKLDLRPARCYLHQVRQPASATKVKDKEIYV